MGACTGLGKAKVTREKGAIVAPDTVKNQIMQNPEDNNEKTDNRAAEYFCEVCGFYPLIAVHGHFECPQCRYKTKCCEGMALDNE